MKEHFAIALEDFYYSIMKVNLENLPRRLCVISLKFIAKVSWLKVESFISCTNVVNLKCENMNMQTVDDIFHDDFLNKIQVKHFFFTLLLDF